MALKTETLNIRVDAELKEQAEKIFSALGIPPLYMIVLSVLYITFS